MNSFEGSTLFISARSPFARRVRIALQEAGVSFQEKVFDVFQPTSELWKANPLSRVPALILNDGQVLIDSNLILQAFYEEVESPFMPRDRKRRHEVLHWMAVSEGICEKTVEYYLETVRQKQYQDPEIFQEVEGICLRSLGALDSRLEGREYLVDNYGQPTQADFDLGIALAYLELRHPLAWKERFPRLGNLLQKLNARPSFRKTAPPPA